MKSNSTYSKIIMAYGPKRKVAITFTGEGRTKQSFKDECDINTIMKRYAATGVLPPAREEGLYVDMTGQDFTAAMQVVAEARSQFEALPSKVRDYFENNPAKFLDYMEDPDTDVLRELGLVIEDPEADSEAQEAPSTATGSPGEPQVAPAASTAPAKPGAGSPAAAT